MVRRISDSVGIRHRVSEYVRCSNFLISYLYDVEKIMCWNINDRFQILSCYFHRYGVSEFFVGGSKNKRRFERCRRMEKQV